jgi:hypothetical protein
VKWIDHQSKSLFTCNTLQLADLQRPVIQEAMRRDNPEMLASSSARTYELRTSSVPSSHCPVVGRLCSSDPLLTNGGMPSRPGVRRIVPSPGSSAADPTYAYSDDVYCLDAEDDDLLPTRMRLQWAQYRVVQRFIMVINRISRSDCVIPFRKLSLLETVEEL